MTRTIVFNHPVPGSGILPGPAPDDALVVVPERPSCGGAPPLPAGTAPTIAGTARLLLDRDAEVTRRYARDET